MNDAEDFWLQCIHQWYPKLHTKTYFLPPLHFNRVQYCVNIVAGETVLVPRIPEDRDAKKTSPPDSAKRICKNTSSRRGSYSLWPVGQKHINPPHVKDSDFREDIALQRVLHCLHALVDNSQPPEVMMIVSQLPFGKYLNTAAYQSDVEFPPCVNKNFKIRQPFGWRGVFNVLIIHKSVGLINLEIKSVGSNFSQLKCSEAEKENIVMEKVKEAISQLNKAETVLLHFVSDLEPLKVTQSLVMPNIKSEQLLRLVKSNPHIEQDLCRCLRTQSVEDAVKLCLLSDQMSGKSKLWDEPVAFKDIFLWWEKLKIASGSLAPMTDSQYEVLVSRVCGPATTVEIYCVTPPRLQIRTEWEGVSETGERMARLVLFPEQVTLLNRSPWKVFLTGPPGSGKTVVLILQGMNWLQQGFDVHVVSTWSSSRAVSFVIVHQLQHTMATWSTAAIESRSNVHFHECELHQETREVNRFLLINKHKQNHVCVIADEAGPEDRDVFLNFCDTLISEIQDVRIWSASLFHKIKPKCLEMVSLSKPMRSPPAVIREVRKAFEIKKGDVYDYTNLDDFVATDGPAVKWCKHQDGQLGHNGNMPHECLECGKQIATVLRELFVGVECIGLQHGPPSLHYRDVLVLCNVCNIHDGTNSGSRTAPTDIGLVQGLRDSHMPVRLVDKGDADAIRDMALGVSDVVSVAHWDDVRGLEKKVVVIEYMHKRSEADLNFRLHHMSRCSSQLIVIEYSSADVVHGDNSSVTSEIISEK